MEQDTLNYDKPNAYDTNTNTTSTLPQEVVDDFIIRAHFINGKLPDVKTNDDDDVNSVTTSLLSQQPSSTTSLTTTIINPITDHAQIVLPQQQVATLLQQSLHKMHNNNKEHILCYDIYKVSLLKPQEHDIFMNDVLVYQKRQPHCYSWGFQNVLYLSNIKIAEARRRAFNKEITIEWGLFDSSTTLSNPLHNSTQSHLLFIYETEFEGYSLRWKRSSLLSHDLTCHIKIGDKWKLLASFDSHRMGYLIHLGKLTLDKRLLQNEYLESHLLITCCTLIDLMREVVEKAVGLNKQGGGVVGSD
ncbi:uncharacterized protein BX663DRAFT_443788 [Cokeromyces recurvatus]|uniref:uncharacterized protein n=1 Tax=Cokeromyces recurvatus TaxID=90255 RepID=UPI00221E4028|nr:uncharacterized protein BX663DRAFT_443788 [Cokeromyces recurvatus]KAI7898069.1 hypothetical protein BX663DRAFT_443788 [Cokeromyces recurvatus]